jgi:hypothetical protein
MTPAARSAMSRSARFLPLTDRLRRGGRCGIRPGTPVYPAELPRGRESGGFDRSGFAHPAEGEVGRQAERRRSPAMKIGRLADVVRGSGA